MPEENKNEAQPVTPIEEKIHAVRIIENSKWIAFLPHLLSVISLIIGAITLVVLFSTVDVSKEQAKIMQGQLDEMKSSSTDVKYQAGIMSGQLSEMKSSSKAVNDQAEIMHRQLDIMKKSIQQADKTLKLLVIGQRPWVTADLKIVSPFTFDSSGGHISIQIALKNIGSTPATEVETYANIYLPGINPITHKAVPPEEKLTAACEPYRNSKIGKFNGATLFPGSILIKTHILTLSMEEINSHLTVKNNQSINIFTNKPIGEMPKFVSWPVLVGCVNYKIPFNDEHHQTGFIRGIDRLLPPEYTQPYPGFDLTKEKESFPTESLILDPGFGDGNAD